MSLAQERLWLLYQFEDQRSLFTILGGLRFIGSLDRNALQASLNAIVQRHETLRSNFVLIDGVLSNVVTPGRGVELTVSDLRHLPDTHRTDESETIAAHERARPFFLDKDPLLRVTLIRMEDDHHILVVAMPHIVSDGWSWRIFVDELSTFYKSRVTGDAVMPTDLPIQYKDFVGWERQWFSSDDAKRQISYWRGRLSGAPQVLNLPVDRRRSNFRTFRGRRHKAILPSVLLADLKAVCLRERATFFMGFATVFAILLRAHCNQDDIVIGTPVANRDRPGVEGLIGSRP